MALMALMALIALIALIKGGNIGRADMENRHFIDAEVVVGKDLAHPDERFPRNLWIW